MLRRTRRCVVTEWLKMSLNRAGFDIVTQTLFNDSYTIGFRRGSPGVKRTLDDISLGDHHA